MAKTVALLFLCFVFFYAVAYSEVGYVVREPVAWGAINKYCVSCHRADKIDNFQKTPEIFAEQLDFCILKMLSNGYPKPTAEEQAALKRFFADISIARGQNGGQTPYLIAPPRGGLAY